MRLGQAGGAGQLQDGDVFALVVPGHAGPVGLAVAEVGDADGGGTVDHVIVGQHHAIGAYHHAGAGASCLTVADRDVDVDQSRIDAGGDGGGIRGPGAGARRAGRRRPASGRLAETSGRDAAGTVARARAEAVARAGGNPGRGEGPRAVVAGAAVASASLNVSSGPKSSMPGISVTPVMCQ